MNTVFNRILVKSSYIIRAMSSITTTATSFKYQPPVARDMKTLDRSFFVTKVPLCVIKFSDPKHIFTFAKEYKSSILRVPRIPYVIKLESSEIIEEASVEGSKNKKAKTLACDNGVVVKGVLLNDAISKIKEVNEKLSPDALQFLKESNAEILPYEYILDYDFWKAEEILRAVLPEEFLDEIPTGFSITGHVAHLNLRKEFKPFDSLIGQVILDKNNKIESVVDKVSSIATKFRTFPMKVIAGKEDNLLVEQKESNCTFRFDFSKVYWNSRLHTEHDRLVTQYFQPGQVVCDVFAGVGPFAIPAGKKEVIVLANDLNPESFKYLQENIDLNKVQPIVKSYNLDGGQFIDQSVSLLENWISEEPLIKLPIRRKKHDKNIKPDEKRFKVIPIPLQVNHYVMNLPDSAIDFLGNFNGVFSTQRGNIMEMPWVHVHCFEKYDNGENLTMDQVQERVYDRIIKSLQTTEQTLPLADLHFHLVRKVSPTKPMFCVSFRLPEPIAYKSN